MLGKKIISAILAFSFTGTAAVLAETRYYKRTEYPIVSENAFVYSPINPERAAELSERISKLISQNGKETEIISALDELYELCGKANDAYLLAHLAADKNSSEENRQAFSEAAETSITVTKSFYAVVELLSNSGYSEVLSKTLGEDIAAEITESIPTEKIYELSKRETELLNEYDVEYGDSDRCAKIYTELVKLRNMTANELGYDNYAEYADKELYCRDFSEEELECFSGNVLTYYKPLLRSLIAVTSTLETDMVSMSEAEVTERVGELLYSVNDELGESYDYMTENGLCDISFSMKKGKASGAYTLFLNSAAVPYIFISPYVPYETDSTETVQTLIHESGHFAAMLNDPANFEDTCVTDNGVITDTAEVNSQGLEMLSFPFYGKYFGSAASGMKYNELTKLVSAVVDGMLFHEFQTMVYREKNITEEKTDEIMCELMFKYYDVELTPEEARYIWCSVPHNFHSPMYYLSYSVSGAAALAILTESFENYSSAIDKYMRFSALGAHISYSEAAELCDMENIFSEECARKTVAAITERYGLGYEDVDYESWYINYIFNVANIFDGKSETEFDPEINITRGEFAELIGKMYYYYNGEENVYTVSFEDVDLSDESAQYIAWASEKGLINGYSETEFGTNDDITREQLAAILYRLYKFDTASDITQSDKAESYKDFEDVSEWARKAMLWAVENEIINGRSENELAPKASATRAETAKIASCYIKTAY